MLSRIANNPVMTWATIGGLVVAVGGALVGVGEGVTPLVAWGGALIEFGVVLGAGAAARAQAYGPRTVDEVMDADAIISAAERGGAPVVVDTVIVDNGDPQSRRRRRR